MSKVIKQYEMETQITQAMMEQWGYSKQHSLNKRKRVSVNGFDVLDTRPPKKQIQEPEEVLEEIPLAEKPRQYGENKDYMRLTEGLFKEFNYVVSYKHRKAKKEVIEIRDPQPKTQLDIIQDQIREMKEEIETNTDRHNLENQFKLNNKLNKLFRKYHKASKEKVKTCSFRQTRTNSYNTQGWRDQISQKQKVPKVYYEFTQERKRADSLLEPFEKMNQSCYAESKKIQTKISQQKEVLELYKSKVEEMRKGSRRQYRSQQQIAQPDLIKVKLQTTQSQPYYYPYEMKIPRTNHKFDFDRINENKQRKQKIFTKLLRNKNAKYIRSKGTNYLIRYNEEEEAKQLLSGKMKKTLYSNHQNEKKQNNHTQNDYDIAVMAGPPQKIPDNRDYEAEFRNERFNASMRMGRKKTVS